MLLAPPLNDGQDSQSGEKEQSVTKKQVMEHRKLPEGCSLDSVPAMGTVRAELVAYISRDKQKTRLSKF